MYTNIENVQILIALMKKFEVKYVVMSPGGSDIPIIHSLENDPYFECFSVVDERSAVYFAMGIAQTKNSPVATVCTSGTAVANYLPGITEAYYQSVPIIAITADKNPYFQGQLEIQKIKQEDIFGSVVKKAVSLPLIRDKNDWWYCERLINEALLETTHHGRGPVHINVPILGSTDIYNCKTLPKVRAINRIYSYDDDYIWDNYIKELSNAKRILVIIGQNVEFSDQDINNLNLFFSKYNCVFSVEHLSNVECDGIVYTYPATEVLGSVGLGAVVPEIVISLGNNLSAYNMKPYLRENSKNIKHWLISESGDVRDEFKCLQNIFECKPSLFFKKFDERSSENIVNDKKYYKDWTKIIKSIILPEFDFSNFYVAKKLSRVIPRNSIMHLAILNSTRVMQFFKLAEGVKVYSNVGALGIDGCFSTFAGQAAGTEQLSYLLIGDLSFFYDMNAAGIKHMGNNVRIILLNNGGGSEFHFFSGKKIIPTINTHICAEHDKVAKGWIESLGYNYYPASTKEEFDALLPILSNKSDTPIFIEVFTQMEEEAMKTRELYSMNNSKVSTGSSLRMAATKIAKSLLSESQIKKARKVYNALRD